MRSSDKGLRLQGRMAEGLGGQIVAPTEQGVVDGMAALLLVLLLALVLFGVGFTLHWLWIAAAIVLIFWLAGFAFRSGTGGGRRWYNW